MLQTIHRTLLRLDPEKAHNVLTAVVKTFNATPQLLDAAVRYFVPETKGEPVTCKGVIFPNAVGMAAGFDKQGYLVLFLQALGFGFVEIGTVLPRPQVGNPRPRIFRFLPKKMLINRMGFNSEGAKAVRQNLLRIRTWIRVPLGISLGMMKETRLKDAHRDYVIVLEELFEFASYIVINVSSPNTPGLRELQGSVYLENLVRVVHDRMIGLSQGGFLPPLFVKIDPDASDEDTLATVAAAVAGEADGVIISNTSKGLAERLGQTTGGASGGIIFNIALHKVALVRKAYPNLFIIGVGGINSGARAMEMRTSGANVIQLYTGFIFEGPRLIRQVVEWMNAWRHTTSRP